TSIAPVKSSPSPATPHPGEPATKSTHISNKFAVDPLFQEVYNKEATLRKRNYNFGPDAAEIARRYFLHIQTNQNLT
ncbi:MAG: hypothetical protein ACLFTI_06575, partial [Anaerolineales bacterium]